MGETTVGECSTGRSDQSRVAKRSADVRTIDSLAHCQSKFLGLKLLQESINLLKLNYALGSRPIRKSPKGYDGPRRRRNQEVYDEIKSRGHQSPLITLSEIHTDPNREP